MLKIQILALAKPNKKITGRGIDQIEHTTTPGDILARIAEEYPTLNAHKRDLIVDKTASIPRIALNDPVNEYYNGHIGEIYRIVDDSSTRFRMVTGPTVRVKTKTSPFHDVTAGMYYSAYNTILDMLKDRRNEGDESTSEVEKLRIKPTDIIPLFTDNNFDQLNIMGLQNRRGQSMYVYFLQMNDERPVSSRKRSSGSKVSFKELASSIIKDTIDDYNSKNAEKLEMPAAVDERSPHVQALLERVEIVVVYNNQSNDNLVKLDLPVQFFSVQQLVFNVTKHVDQPSFYLLDPNKDREEILDVLSLNGLVLDKGHSMSDFNIKDGAKLILL
jgi:DNA-directed RNA polymerase subunit H (RpoH/RPB5)